MEYLIGLELKVTELALPTANIAAREHEPGPIERRAHELWKLVEEIDRLKFVAIEFEQAVATLQGPLAVGAVQEFGYDGYRYSADAVIFDLNSARRRVVDSMRSAHTWAHHAVSATVALARMMGR